MSWFEKMEFPTCPVCKSNNVFLISYGGDPELLKYSSDWVCHDCECTITAHYHKVQTYDRNGERLVPMTPLYDNVKRLVCPYCGSTNLRMYSSWGLPNNGEHMSYHICDRCDMYFAIKFRIDSLEIKKPKDKE